MGQFQLSPDSAALLLSGVATAGFGGLMLASPKSAHTHFYGESAVMSANHETTMRWCGLSQAAVGAFAVAAALGDSSAEGKKLALKVAAGQWLVAAAANAYHAKEGSVREGTAWGRVALNAAIGGLCLWRALASDAGASGGKPPGRQL